MSEFTLKIDGMHCGSCVKRVSQTLASAGDLEVREVRIGAARVSSTGQGPADTSEAKAIAALAKAGFSAHLDQ
jgi:copper chaperone CopZ